jgi:hypothetical protein
MNTELFVTCDFAQDNAGKLTVVGAFDTINAKVLPVGHPFMSIALRMRFFMHELGEHSLRVEFLDPEGESLAATFDNRLNISNIGTDSLGVNLVINHVGLQLKLPGKNEVRLYLDDELQAAIPLYVRLSP